jgi:hypothetical protein
VAAEAAEADEAVVVAVEVAVGAEEAAADAVAAVNFCGGDRELSCRLLRNDLFVSVSFIFLFSLSYTNEMLQKSISRACHRTRSMSRARTIVMSRMIRCARCGDGVRECLPQFADTKDHRNFSKTRTFVFS